MNYSVDLLSFRTKSKFKYSLIKEIKNVMNNIANDKNIPTEN